VHHLVLLALLVFAAAVLSGLAAAALRGLDAWRAFRQLKRTSGHRLGELDRRFVQLEARSAGAADHARRIEQAQRNLQKSLAEAAVIGSAAGEVWTFVSLVRGAVPSK
jgi:hypothetical protein